MSGDPLSPQHRRAPQGAFDAVCLVVFIGGSALILLATLAKALLS